MIDRFIKHWSVAAGTNSVDEIDLSIVDPCFVKKVGD